MIRVVLLLWWYKLYYKLTFWIKVNTLSSRSSYAVVPPHQSTYTNHYVYQFSF